MSKSQEEILAQIKRLDLRLGVNRGALKERTLLQKELEKLEKDKTNNK